MMQQTITAYHLAFSFFSKVIAQAPGEELLGEINKNELMSDWPLAPQHENTDEGLAILQDCFAQPVPYLNDAIQQDYFRLFEQSPPLCRPWESVWRNKQKLLFDEETFQVRQWYTRFGLQAPNYNREPDDHLGLELGFIAYLLNLMADEAEQTESGEVSAAISSFLQDHLMAWGTECLLDIATKAQTGFYKGIGLLAAGNLVELNALLNAE